MASFCPDDLKAHFDAPLVALESTVITHGLPFPRNIEVAVELEEKLLQMGVKPMTCGVVDGNLVAGLTRDQIRVLGMGMTEGRNIRKISRRDVPVAVTRKYNGGTTVSATMLIASSHSVEVFVTGGIGGVHRGWSTTHDVSCDLEELARTPCVVVCAGAKAILDIPATMEYLETKGVTVLGYQTDYVPAFYSRRTSQGLKIHVRCDSADEIADIWKAQRSAGLSGGLLVMNPIPQEAEIPADVMEVHIEAALAEATDRGISGSSVTPFVLSALDRLTTGKSVEANLALLYSNAILGAEISLALYGKRKHVIT